MVTFFSTDYTTDATHIVDGDSIQKELPDQFGHKDKRTFEHTDQYQISIFAAA